MSAGRAGGDDRHEDHSDSVWDGGRRIQYPHLGLVLVATVSLGTWWAGYRAFTSWFLVAHLPIAVLTIVRGIRRHRGPREIARRTYFFTFGIWFLLLDSF
ncbi:hypothetical protein [Kitasatospora sp. NPDC004289]